ncbi:unnamed protein product [Pieris brassicae]|uniref:Uncharacterized protein n=1 Tax=Pieris brassicae TaxID=7116 RepID=A0A9P0T4U1_PIEBR|nr:unnamed protein product [Pieris brassicae]
MCTKRQRRCPWQTGCRRHRAVDRPSLSGACPPLPAYVAPHPRCLGSHQQVISTRAVQFRKGFDSSLTIKQEASKAKDRREAKDDNGRPSGFAPKEDLKYTENLSS